MKKINRLNLIVSLLFSIINSVGMNVYNYNDCFYMFKSFKQFIITFILFIVLFFLSYHFLNKVLPLLRKCDKKPKNKTINIFKNKNIYLYIFIINVLLFIPILLAYYPGIFSYDSLTQYNMIFSTITKYHPPIHTELIHLCIILEGVLNISFIFIYSLIQLTITSYLNTRIIKFFIEKNVNKQIIVFTFIWLIINPVVRIMNIVMTKDILFSYLFLFLIIEIIKFISNDKCINNKKNYIKMGLLILLTCLFRNNAIYVFIITFIIISIIYKKQLKQVLVLFFIQIIIFFIVNNGVYKLLGYQNGPSVEMFSVPIQQIAVVVYNHSDELTKEELETIDKYVSIEIIKQSFNYRLSDPIKDYFDVGSKKEFLSLYLKLFFKYPGEYISEFLNLNIPYWYIGASTIDKYSQREYIETDSYELEGIITEDSKIPSLKNYYNNIASYKLINKMPVINIIYSITFPIYLIIFTLITLIDKKKSKELIVLIPYILLWLTYLLGPVSNFRYIYPIFISYPLFIAMMFNSNKIISSK